MKKADPLHMVELAAEQSALNDWKWLPIGPMVDGAPCPGTLHLLDAERELSKEDWDFEMEPVIQWWHIATMREMMWIIKNTVTQRKTLM